MMADERTGMSLVGSFSGAVKSRGRDYYRSGAVHRLRREGDIVRAVVAGSTAYDVTLHLKDGKAVRAECTCPFFAERGKPCKHEWAVMLAARRQWPEMREAVEEQQQSQPPQQQGGEQGQVQQLQHASEGGDRRVVRRQVEDSGNGASEPWERQLEQL